MPIIGNFGGGGGNVTSDGKTHLSLEDVFGPGPYEIEFTEDDDSSVSVQTMTLDEDGVLRMVNSVVVPSETQMLASSVVAAQNRADAAYALAESRAHEETYMVAVPVAWSVDATYGGFTQTIAVAGITEADNPIWDLVLGTNPATNDSHEEAYALIDRLTTANGSITLWANAEAPTVAITIQLKVVR